MSSQFTNRSKSLQLLTSLVGILGITSFMSLPAFSQETNSSFSGPAVRSGGEFNPNRPQISPNANTSTGYSTLDDNNRNNTQSSPSFNNSTGRDSQPSMNNQRDSNQTPNRNLTPRPSNPQNDSPQ